VFELEGFQQIQNSMNVLTALLSNVNSWKNPCSRPDFIYAQRARECRQTCFLLKFNLSHKLHLLNLQH